MRSEKRQVHGPKPVDPTMNREVETQLSNPDPGHTPVPRFRVLAIDTGATSTKLGIFEGSSGATAVGVAAEGFHDVDASVAVERFMAEHDVTAGRIHAVVARGGLLPPLESGVWRIDEAMVAELRRARRGRHASNLAAPLASEVAERLGVPAFVVDPVSTDELVPEARLSGLAPVPRESLFHALNVRAVARRYAAGQGARLEELALVVAHLGTGISVAALVDGLAVDVVNPRDEGPFSPDRCGGVPSFGLLEWIESSGIPFDAARKRLFGEGGLYGYFGTRELRDLEAAAFPEEGEGVSSSGATWAAFPGPCPKPGSAAFAGVVWRAMVLQIAKAVAEMVVSCRAFALGRMDAVLVTGGMARSGRLLAELTPRIAFLGPVVAMPGEDELLALAEGALRVLADEERARDFGGRSGCA
jgi:butyrate kinase